jgi:superfamily II RNA helicase
MKLYGKAIALLLLLSFHLAGILYVFDAGGDSRETKVRLEYTGKENKELKASMAATAAAQDKNNKLSGELATAQAAIIKRERELSKLRNQYETLAQRSNDCNLTIGSVLLHNARLGYEYDPRQLDEAGRALSSITGSAFIQHCDELATEFELQRQQLNKFSEAEK